MTQIINKCDFKVKRILLLNGIVGVLFYISSLIIFLSDKSYFYIGNIIIGSIFLLLLILGVKVIHFKLKHLITLKEFISLVDSEEIENINRDRHNLNLKWEAASKVNREMSLFRAQQKKENEEKLIKNMGIGMSIGLVAKLMFGFPLPGLYWGIRKLGERMILGGHEIALHNKYKPQYLPVFDHPQLPKNLKDHYFRMRDFSWNIFALSRIVWIIFGVFYVLKFSFEKII